MTITNSYRFRIFFSVIWINRFALFIIYFWFGLLKIISKSPAEALITNLHRITISRLVGIRGFLVALGIMECAIGILWLVPKCTKWTLIVFFSQVLTTLLPLFILRDQTWSDFLVLSLSGQYILKNIVLIACALTIYKDYQLRNNKFRRVEFPL